VRCDGDPWPFAPGQYVTLGIDAGTGLVERPYSIASSARRVDDGYELYVRLVPEGALTPLLFAGSPGRRVTLRRPKGRFTLRDGDDRVHLFVATGCGLAPFMSMLRTLVDERAPRRVVLLHGVSYVAELSYREELERLVHDPRWQLVYVPTISRPREPANTGWSGCVGRVERILPEVWADLGLTSTATMAYLCGNPGMVISAREFLRQRGFGAEQVREELYWPRAERR